ncbi:unnamed protein product [Arabis nemorensis]|uniref:Uncharacterized protein n=1 Tax=Arabis nemorensis TaxID=586526 RepID=A0A565CGM9_9BRAS|nr:unnamed protein product [Arabis nemorensis]
MSTYGCIGNLLGCFKDLSATQVSTFKSILPHYYRCKKQLLNIITEQPRKLKFADSGEPVVLIDPKSHGNDQSTEDKGFVKRDTKFTVTDDLIITPMNSSSAFCLLKKLQNQADDLEATSLLRASLVTSSALNTALWNLIAKKP